MEIRKNKNMFGEQTLGFTIANCLLTNILNCTDFIWLCCYCCCHCCCSCFTRSPFYRVKKNRKRKKKQLTHCSPRRTYWKQAIRCTDSWRLFCIHFNVLCQFQFVLQRFQGFNNMAMVCEKIISLSTLVWVDSKHKSTSDKISRLSSHFRMKLIQKYLIFLSELIRPHIARCLLSVRLSVSSLHIRWLA